jgi:hypothetical protein
VENFYFVQRAPLPDITHRPKAVEIRGFVFDPQSSDAPAWRHCAMAATLICGCGKADWRREVAICERKREVARNIAGNERPVRG